MEPVPITATRWPFSGQVASQRAECSRRPWNSSSPGISGHRGWLSGPALHTKKRERMLCALLVVNIHWPVASSKLASLSWVLKRMRAVMPWRSASSRM